MTPSATTMQTHGIQSKFNIIMDFQDRKTCKYIGNFINGNVSLPKCELYFSSALGSDYSFAIRRYYTIKDKRFFSQRKVGQLCKVTTRLYLGD